MKKLLLLTILLCSSLLCQAQKERPILGDEQTAEYFPILKVNGLPSFPIIQAWWETSTYWISYWKMNSM